MIRLVQRKLIIPRGDTGSFSLPAIGYSDDGIAVFSIINLKTRENIFQKTVAATSDTITIEFTHDETVELPVGHYVWDVTYYADPEYETDDDGEQVLVGGSTVDSYYSAYNLPSCEIRIAGN